MDWKETYRDRIVSAAEAVKCVKSGDTVVLQQAAGTATYLMDALTDRAGELENVKVIAHNLWEVPRFLEPRYAGTFPGISASFSTGVPGKHIGRDGWTRYRHSTIRCRSITGSIRRTCFS